MRLIHTKTLFFVGIAVLIGLVSCKEKTTTLKNIYDSSQKAPKVGDKVIIRVASDPDHLNVLSSITGTGQMIVREMYDGLMAINPHTSKLEPKLVVGDPQISEDGKIYSFEIRPEAKWDDGSEITGHDVAFTMKIINNPLTNATSYREVYQFVTDVVVDETNPKKFSFVTTGWKMLGLAFLATLDILPKAGFDADGLMDKFTVGQLQREGKSLEKDPAIIRFAEKFNSPDFQDNPEFLQGSGPYKLVSWEPNIVIKLKRKENYWAHDIVGKNPTTFAAWPTELIFKVIDDNVAAVTELKNQGIDVYFQVPAPDFLSLQQNSLVSDHYDFFTPESPYYAQYGMNLKPNKDKNQLFKEKAVRKAVAHLLDVDLVIDKIYSKLAKRTVGPIVPHKTEEYNPDITPVPYDVEMAKKLLKEGGWADSDADGILDKIVNGKKQNCEFDLMIAKTGQAARKVSLLFQENAMKAGVKINIDEQEYGTMVQNLYAHNFDMYGLTFSSSPLPTDLSQGWHSDSWNGGLNFTGFGTEDTDGLIDQIADERSVEKRKELFQKFQEILAEEQPAIFLFNPLQKIVIHKRFKNSQAGLLSPGFYPRSFWTPSEHIKYK